jgi:high-affinity iron transporter
MLASFLLTLREGFEIALILGIVLSILRKLERRELYQYIWIGAGAAALVCAMVGFVLYRAGKGLEGPAEPVFEGLSMLAAAAILTWMIFWMHRQSRGMRGALEKSIGEQLEKSGGWPLIWLAFFSVLREGLELVLFLLAAAFIMNASSTLAGALLGICAAALLGWILFSTTHKFSIRTFFRVTNIFLFVFAAGLVAHGVHELTEAGWLQGLIDPIYNLNAILSDQSTLGSLLGTLVGYSSSPTLMDTLAYLLYFGAVFVAFRWTLSRPPAYSRG